MVMYGFSTLRVTRAMGACSERHQKTVHTWRNSILNIHFCSIKLNGSITSMKSNLFQLGELVEVYGWVWIQYFKVNVNRECWQSRTDMYSRALYVHKPFVSKCVYLLSLTPNSHMEKLDILH